MKSTLRKPASSTQVLTVLALYSSELGTGADAARTKNRRVELVLLPK